MHISKAYEHEPILPYQAGESSCPINNCSKVGTQCVDIAAPMTLTPTAAIGVVTVSCQGNPVITCQTGPDSTSCTVTMTQRVCVSVPVCYGVTMTTGEPTIVCADTCCTSCG